MVLLISLSLSVTLLLVILLVPPIRRPLITRTLLKLIHKLHLLPTISETETIAIEAGTPWIETEYFTGKPNLDRLRQQSYPTPDPILQNFLDHQVETVCHMANDWDIYQNKDLPPEVWDYLKQERFFGMMIPKEYGGLGFNYLAYSTVMTKLASRSFTHTATVGVTNSLGPAKLLLSYGTEAQKQYYLPRLANGEEIPCFALTEPSAGSDAASITAEGTLFRDADGNLAIRLNWQKRYITLGAIATLLGLAFRLKDPDNLLNQGTDRNHAELGITCALIPADTPGVHLERRHDPMGVPFYNSPTEGHDVVISAEQIIGGLEQAGQGWKMLMQSLAAGRGIGFPATATGIAKLVTRVTSNYTKIRHQFGLSIGKFGGIEEPLARIGAKTYLLDAVRLYTCGAVDQGDRSAVVAAIAKYSSTELSRQIINDGMDILGGAGICRGPRNLLANIYIATPIPITVEGANILTRTLMIFGQGVIRSHPYLYREIKAIQTNDIVEFDRALFQHLGFVIKNSLRTAFLNLTRARLVHSPVKDQTAPYYRKLTWASANFAFLTDLALVSLGGDLKRQEKLTGRYADALSWLYLCTATLRRYEAEGSPAADRPLVDWILQHGFSQIQQALEGILSNLPIPVVGFLLRPILLTCARLNPIATPPSDRLSHEVAQLMQTDLEVRDRLTHSLYLPNDPTEALGRLEQAFTRLTEVEPLMQKIKAATKHQKLPKGKPEHLLSQALAAGILSDAEFDQLRQAEAARLDAIQVDSFAMDTVQSKVTA
jgi:acyl-CoA dehydrogenase